MVFDLPAASGTFTARLAVLNGLLSKADMPYVRAVAPNRVADHAAPIAPMPAVARGGRAGLAIGRRLAALSRSAQVVVVTHLPQVAAFADRHLVVHKTSDGHVTASGVRAVTGDDRLAELARMMARSDSAPAREHAAGLPGIGRAARPGRAQGPVGRVSVS